MGGLILTLMTLPTIIIASRAALKSVPPSIRVAALGMGASRMQMIFHHVLPLALPGMLTGTIIGMAQALGGVRPLLMIGMVAFIVDIPGGPLEPATAMPVQIFLWADSPERAFVERDLGRDHGAARLPDRDELLRDLAAPEVRASLVARPVYRGPLASPRSGP